MTSGRHKHDWEDLAALDPCWAVLSDPGRLGRWDTEEFFQTGRREIERVMAQAQRLGRPARRSTALDFGCGVGRLTVALAEEFDRCIGVDISEGMVVRARELHADVPNCEFVVGPSDALPPFPDERFDLVYTNLVLQHLPSRDTVYAYLDDFMRTLAPDGLLVFQLPSWIRPRNRLQPRRRVYGVLRGAGVSPDTLVRRLRVNPMRMNYAPIAEVTARIEAARGQVLETEVADELDGARQTTYFVARRIG